jgi:AcrR family transcriptional regulator
MKTDNETKKRIRANALSLFAEKPFEEVTLNDICEKSGVNKQTFYYYFKSKDDLLDGYYNITYQLKTADLSTILTADSYVEQLWLLNRPMIDFIENAGITILRQVFIKNINKKIGTFSFSPERKQLLQLQKQIIEKGQACGQFHSKVDAGYLAFLFFQMLMASAIFLSMSGGEFSFKDHLRYSYEQAFDVDEKYRKMSGFQAHYPFLE